MNGIDSLTTTVARGTLGILGAVKSPRLSILIFHRVHRNTDNIFLREPDAARFDHLMRFVAPTYRVMTLGKALTCLAQDNLPPRALVITFDDGYADNADVALPILQRYGLTASFFVSTGFLDGGRMWNDSVIECLRACRHDKIDLEPFGLGVLPLATAKDRRQAIEQLLLNIKYLKLSERENAVVRLQQLCNVPNLPTNLMMRAEQVKTLQCAGMEVGAHTINHPILTTLTLAQAEDEIVQGRNQLQSIIDAPVDVFAYPNGKPGLDYDQTHLSLLKANGFRGAVSTATGVSQAGDDLFQLPRFTPWNESVLSWGMRLVLNQKNTRFDTATLPS